MIGASGGPLIMCGTRGILYLDTTRRVDREVPGAMNRQLVHRGPDDGGFFIEGNVGLAMHLLSIIDIRTGHKPVSNENDSVSIVYHGEIYNHQLCADLDAKGHTTARRAIPTSIFYEQCRRDCMKHLRGMFAFAIWDKSKRQLFAARDRLGIKLF
jgi:asparagine synthase (glutamine-hydrolysing)